MGEQEINRRLSLYEGSRHMERLQYEYEKDTVMGTNELLYSKGYNNISRSRREQ